MFNKLISKCSPKKNVARQFPLLNTQRVSAKAYWANCCLFCKKSVVSSVRLIFCSAKICQALPIYKCAVVLPRSETDFINLQATIWRNTPINKIWARFWNVSFQAEGRQNIFHFLCGNQIVKVEDLYLGMQHNDQYSRYSEYNYYSFHEF